MDTTLDNTDTAALKSQEEKSPKSRDAKSPPSKPFLDIQVRDPITHGTGRARFTDYEIRLKVIILSRT